MLLKSFLSVNFLLLVSAASCEARRGVELKLYAGDSKTQSIVSKKRKEKISCSAERFNDYVCMSYEDFVKMHPSNDKGK